MWRRNMKDRRERSRLLLPMGDSPFHIAESPMTPRYRVLSLGASYGSLLATKLALAGHDCHLICLPAEADLINREGAVVRMPVKGRSALVEIDSRRLSGKLSAGGTAGVNPSQYDLVVLAMQEPQYRSPGVRELLDA